MSRKKKKKNNTPLTSSQKHRKKEAELSAPPPRTSHFDKKKKKQVSGSEIISQDKDKISYEWTEDDGGENVQLKRRTFLKDHAKAMPEDEWASINGSLCKINKGKFDEGMENIFGEREKGAQNGKFKRTKKVYK